MQIKKLSPKMVRVALMVSALATVSAASSLLGQQTQVPALAVPAAPAPAPTSVAVAPAPRSSALFERTDADAPTIASAQAANDAAMAGGSHTIVVSTLVLVLAIVILVLLIA